MEEFTRVEIQTSINTYALDYSFTNSVILQTPRAGLSKSYRTRTAQRRCRQYFWYSALHQHHETTSSKQDTVVTWLWCCPPVFLINRCFSTCQPTIRGASLSQKHLFSDRVASVALFSKIFQACTVKIPWILLCPTECWTRKALKTNGLKQNKFNAVSSVSVDFLHTKYQSLNDKENRYLPTIFTHFHSILTHAFFIKASNR